MRNNEAIDRLVVELSTTREESLLVGLFARLDLETEKVWLVDQDDASAALVTVPWLQSQ